MKRLLFILSILMTLLVVVYSQVAPKAVPIRTTNRNVADSSDTRPIRVPVVKTQPQTMEDVTANPPIELRNPTNVNTKMEYDPETGIYQVVTRLGNEKIGTPINLTQEEYLQFRQEQSTAAYWKSKNIVDRSKGNQNFSLTDMQFDIGAAEKIFGEGGVRLKTQGSIETKIGLHNNKVDNPSLSENARNKTTFKFDPQIQMSVNGKVGDKIDVNMNYDTEATFKYDAKSVKLRYDGKEDEIIKSLEAGNVSMPLNSSLITGGTSLFGIKSELKFGKLSVAAVVSQQNAQTKSVNLEGGAQTRKFERTIDGYDENRHFFLSHFFREHYDEWMSELPYISSGITVTKVEVWVTNKTGVLDNARNIVAFADMAEPKLLSNAHWLPNGPAIPSNASNSLYSEITNVYSDARSFNQVNATFQPLSDLYGIDIGKDYERLESARRLESSDYVLNPTLGYISLKQSLNNDEILAVSYEYTYRGSTYQVGEFSTDGIQPPQTLFVKLLKGTSQSPRASTWDLMMKNIYTLGDAYNLKSENFKLDIVYRNDSIGTGLTYLTEGAVKNQQLLRVMGLDQLNTKQQAYPDGLFDFVEGYTVQSTYGRIIFPVLEPFGSHLRKKIANDAIADKYVFEELYDSTLTVAQQLTEKMKFLISGEYMASTNSSISLGAYNIPQGSVTVTAGGQLLTENVDYTVDYAAGMVSIINTNLLTSGTAINATCEDQTTFSMMRKSMTGLSLNYTFSNDFSVGGTVMRLSERPLTTKVDMGSESVSNTIFGFNTAFKTQSQFLTNLIDKLPLINATKPSTLKVNAEYAQLVAGTSNELGNLSYIDDFEASKKTYNLKEPNQWFLASAPYDPSGGLFPEAALSNDLTYGYNRSLLAWYTIDGMFNYSSNSQTPSHIRNDKEQQSNHFVRVVNEKEIFPNRNLSFNQVGVLPCLNLAYYPKERGPYNFDVNGMKSDGTLSNPAKRWGGIMRKIESGYTNFESNNVEYVEFWLMDPFIYDTTRVSRGGDLYIDLGELSEDVLKDGKRAFENGLPTNASEENMVNRTVWGKVSSKSTTAYSFDNTKGIRLKQDVGLDGLSDDEERTWPGIAEYVQGVKNKLTPEALDRLSADPFSPLNDPSGDDYHYYRGSDFDSKKTSILNRYKRYNGMEANSLSTENTNETYSTASTTLPNVEDINMDFTLNETERYYQYRVSIRPNDTVIGKNYINDVRVATVTLKNGKTAQVKWYQFKIPVRNYDKRVGTISGFNSIRFMRMFLTDFQDSVILRFGTLDLVRGDWRQYTKSLNVLGAPVQPQTIVDVSTVSLEENGGRSPINYKLPPGVNRESDPSQPGLYMEDERSLALKVKHLYPNDARAVYKNTSYDFRQYERLQLYVHAEGMVEELEQPDNYELTAFIRLGSDYQSNYYEYEIPLEMSPFYNQNARSIWPQNNVFDIPFALLTKLKAKRNAQPVINYTTEYVEYDPEREQNKVKIKGNPTLSDVSTIMIGVRNRSGVVQSVELWVNELRLSGFKEGGGFGALGSAVLGLSDLATVTASGKYLSDGFGGLEQGVSQRRKDTYSQYNMAVNTDFGKLFPAAAKINVPFYYSLSQEKTLPKYDPLNEDVLLNDELKVVGKAMRDSILDYSQTLRTYKSLNLSNIKVNIRNKVPLPIDPANFSFNYMFTESLEHDPTTEYKRTQQYNGGVNYNYTSPLQAWEPFANNEKLKAGWSKLLKDFNLNFLPGSLSASSKLIRQYYELQTRNLSAIDPALTTPLVVSKNFLWNTDLNVNWDLTKNLNLNMSINNQAEVEETRYSPVNKELYATEYQNWKDTVRRSLLKFGDPLNYNQTVNVTWSVPLDRIPGLSFMTLNTQYNAIYEWERSTTNSKGTNLGNQISNQRSLNVNATANLVDIYNKSPFLKQVLSDKKAPATTKKPDQKQAASQVQEAVPQRIVPESMKNGRRYVQTLTLLPDSSYLIKHNLNNKRVDVVAVDAEGKKVSVAFRVSDENNIHVSVRKLQRNISLSVVPKTPFEDASWYTAASVVTRTLMAVRNLTVTFRQADGLTIPGFVPESGLLSRGDNGMAPGWDYALGLQGNNYLQRIADKGWLIVSDSIITPASQSSNKDLKIKSSLDIFPGLKADLNWSRTWNDNTKIQYMYVGMPESRTGNFSMSTIALRSAFESSKASNGYASKSFERFLKNKSVVAGRLNKNMEGVNYPRSGFLQNSPLAEKPFDSSVAGYNENSADVLIPAFLAAYTGKDASKSSLSLFPGIWAMLPNWSISYDGLSKVEFIKKAFRSFTLNHAYVCNYGVSSFSSYSSWVNAGDGIGFVRDVLTNNPVPSSLYDVSSVSLTESFNPLLRVQGTLNSGWTLKSEMRKTRTLNLSISGGQVVESTSNQFTMGTSYKLSDFHPWGFMTGSKMQNDLSLSGDLSYKNQYALLRKIVGKYAQASSGNNVFEVNLMADYTISRNMNLAFFYDLQSTVPLVSSYPVTSSDIGFSVKFSLNR